MPRHHRQLDTINRSGNAKVAPRPFPVRHYTSKTQIFPLPSPLLPLPRTRSARNFPDSENPGNSTYDGLHYRSLDQCFANFFFVVPPKFNAKLSRPPKSISLMIFLNYLLKLYILFHTDKLLKC